MFNKKRLFLVLSCGLSSLLLATQAHAQNQMQNDMYQQQQQGQAQQPNQQVTQIQWFTNYQEAVAKAKSEKKPIVLFFTGSDWCGWCKKMESEILTSPEFVRAAGGNFVFVELDFPMNKNLAASTAEQNAALKQKYGVTGYPTVIVLDPNENFIAESGYRSGGGKAYADYLLGLTR